MQRRKHITRTYRTVADVTHVARVPQQLAEGDVLLVLNRQRVL